MAAWTQTDLDKLCAAIAQGATTVQYQDKRVTYRSLDEMLKIKQLMEQELGLKKKNGRVYAEHSKGTC